MRAVAMLCTLMGVGQAAAGGLCAHGDFEVDFWGSKPAGIPVTGPSLVTPGLDLHEVHSKLVGTTAFVPAGPFPLAGGGGEVVTVRCCAAAGCEVLVGAYTCFPCSAGRNGMIPSTLRNKGWDSTACGARFGPDNNPLGTFRGFLDAATPELSFVLDGPTDATAVWVRSLGAAVTVPVALPPTATSQFVHGIAVVGGLGVQITSSHGPLTYTPAGLLADGDPVWGDRTYLWGYVPAALQGATYFRPSLHKSIPAGTTITVSAIVAPTQIFMLAEKNGNRHGLYPTTLPLAGWTHVLEGQEPKWMANPSSGYPFSVFMLGATPRVPSAEWCPRPAGPFPACVCPLAMNMP